MSCLILPRRFYSQPSGIPEIDWSNPLTSKLLYAVIPGSSHPIECVSPNDAVWTKVGTPTINAGTEGLAVNINSYNSAWEMPAIRLTTDFAYGTMGVIFHQNSTSSLDGCYAILTYSDDGDEVPYTSIGIKSSGALLSSLIASLPYSPTLPTLSNSVYAGNDYLAVVRSSYDLQQLYLFNRGIGSFSYDDTSENTRITTSYGSNPKLVIGEDYRSSSRRCNAGIQLVAVWDRSIGDSELNSFQHNPWQIFKAK